MRRYTVFSRDIKANPAMVDSSGNPSTGSTGSQQAGSGQDWYVWFSGSGYVRGGPYALTIP